MARYVVRREARGGRGGRPGEGLVLPVPQGRGPEKLPGERCSRGSSRGLCGEETYLTGTSMVLRPFKRPGASVRGRSSEQPLAAPWVAGTLRARSGASLHVRLLATGRCTGGLFCVVTFLFSGKRVWCTVASLRSFYSPAESMLANHPNVRPENTFSMKFLILNHFQSVPRVSSVGTFVNCMKFQILNLRTSVNYVAWGERCTAF